MDNKKSKSEIIRMLYNDWLEYKEWYRHNMNLNMKESFIEYLNREIPEYQNNDGTYGGF